MNIISRAKCLAFPVSLVAYLALNNKHIYLLSNWYLRINPVSRAIIMLIVMRKSHNAYSSHYSIRHLICRLFESCFRQLIVSIVKMNFIITCRKRTCHPTSLSSQEFVPYRPSFGTFAAYPLVTYLSATRRTLLSSTFSTTSRSKPVRGLVLTPFKDWFCQHSFSQLQIR